MNDTYSQRRANAVLARARAALAGTTKAKLSPERRLRAEKRIERMKGGGAVYKSLHDALADTCQQDASGRWLR